jgi:hypothetical protein
MTISTAAQLILYGVKTPMSPPELADQMQSRGLVEFRIPSPRSLVLAALKRHSCNSHSCQPAKAKTFRETGD